MIAVTINNLQFQIKPNHFSINLGKWQCGLDCQQIKFAWKTALYLSCNYIKRQIVLVICHHNVHNQNSTVTKLLVMLVAFLLLHILLEEFSCYQVSPS